MLFGSAEKTSRIEFGLQMRSRAFFSVIAGVLVSARLTPLCCVHNNDITEVFKESALDFIEK